MAIHEIKASPPIDLANARQVVLEVVNAKASAGPGYFQAGSLLNQVSKRLGISGNIEAEQAVLTIWYDLFRVGMLAPGYNLSNPDLPFVHLTAAGRTTLSNINRDPSNPDGYTAYLAKQGLTDPIAQSYICEAVMTYNSSCYKASAVMVGCATERLVLLVRDEIVAGMGRQSTSIPNNLNDWRYKTVRDAITSEINVQSQNLRPRRLKESYDAFWVPLTEQPRLYRNDAGHPQSIDPVSQETVHSNLLIFPELAGLVYGLVNWIKSHYV